MGIFILLYNFIHVIIFFLKIIFWIQENKNSSVIIENIDETKVVEDEKNDIKEGV